MNKSPTVSIRPLRADAERNRRRVLEVAEEVFAAEGLTVPIDEIARRAGFGVGTLYRHFPTKETLIAAIVATRMDDQSETIRALLETGSREPDTFFRCLDEMVRGWGQKKHFIEALVSAGADLAEIKRAKHEFHEALGMMLARAQEDGFVRKEISVHEIVALLAGTFMSADRHDIGLEGRDRMLAILYDGLRPQRSAGP